MCNLFVNILDNISVTQPTFQRRINVVSTLWINETKSDVGYSTLHDVDTPSVPDVETKWKQRYTTSKQRCTTLYQRCFNLAWTLVKAILNPVGLVIIKDL